MCGLIFPRQNIASALHPFQQNRPIPLFLLIVRTVFPDLPQQVFFGCFILLSKGNLFHSVSGQSFHSLDILQIFLQFL